MTAAARTLAALLAATLVSVGLAVAAPATAGAAHGASSVSPQRYEARVQKQINRQRARHGLAALRSIRCADGTAGRWSARLAREDAFYHQDMRKVLTRCKARWAGETLGKGGISPRKLVRMWMRSPGHRAILLSRNAKRIGIGSVVDSHGQWLTTANFVKR